MNDIIYGMNSQEIRLNKRYLDLLKDSYQRRQKEIEISNKRSDIIIPKLQLHDYLTYLIIDELENIKRLEDENTVFNSNFSRSITDSERQQHIINYASTLGAKGKELRKDRRAIKRWLWHDTVESRYFRKSAEIERRLAFWFNRLGQCRIDPGFWAHNMMEPVLEKIFENLLDPRVLTSCLTSIGDILVQWSKQIREEELNQKILNKIYQLSINRELDIWVQTGAIRVLRFADYTLFKKVLIIRMSQHESGNDLFVRRKVLKLAEELLTEHTDLENLLSNIINDPSAYVRQQFTITLCHTQKNTFNQLFPQLLFEDKSIQVRASAILAFEILVINSGSFVRVKALLIQVLNKEKNSFVLRTALKVAVDIAVKMIKIDRDVRQNIRDDFNDILYAIDKLHINAEDFAVRRWAALTLEQFWGLFDKDAGVLLELLSVKIKHIKNSKRKILSKKDFNQYSDDLLGRTMSLLSQQDHGLGFIKEVWWNELIRGTQFRFKWWRFFHEISNAKTDKRQGYLHTHARSNEGGLRAPSSILAELTETDVPGEPVMVSTEQGWRPYIPLIEDYLSCTGVFSKGKPVLIFSAEGITTITPPGSLWERIKAGFFISLKFSNYTALRNRLGKGIDDPDIYIKTISNMGFKTGFRTYPDLSGKEYRPDPAVLRFFPSLSFLPVRELWELLKDYFVSIYENSFTELMLFALTGFLLFIGRHIYLNYRQRKLRRKIPLVIGGWGTRGKSGTERLKAALINALGYGVLSKTTGSEATFLHSYSFGQLYEIPLFRPYDKATIWEQQDVTKLADGLNVETFLWECMALQPSYVEILQRSWMRDDISTITNTYPDHEDIMGPAGIDIPVVMTNFIPKNAFLITSEEQMLPILDEAAKDLDTSVNTAGWLEAGLITDDILERYPYNEHPYNIALVLKLAEQLGVDSDFVLKETGSRVVSEIGMLKTFPIAEILSRKLEFTNGMAANERVGMLSNWERVKYLNQDYIKEPGIFISTVVNNRADRVPRSRVFAHILANDISADRHFLIGSNLSGLKGFLKESWKERVVNFSLWSKTLDEKDKKSNALFQLKKALLQMRICFSEDAIKNRLFIMLSSIIDKSSIEKMMGFWQKPKELEICIDDALSENKGELKNEIIYFLKEMLDDYASYLELAKRISKVQFEEMENLDKEFKNLLTSLFERKIIIILDYHATGDAVINQITKETPPGILNKVMGIQNIKGTGMSFINVWIAWERCCRLCNLSQSPNENMVNTALKQLASFSEYGVLSFEKVTNTLKYMDSATTSQNDAAQANLMMIQSNFDRVMETVEQNLKQESRHDGFFIKLLLWIEGFIDAGDAVRRRKKANLIYKDLESQRISHERAIKELYKLNKRQKGGWMYRQIQTSLNLYHK